jgi:hypothetical protein
MESTLNRHLADDSYEVGVTDMPDTEALIKYIEARQAYENDGIGYSFVRELPPNLQDTFFAVSCLRRLGVEFPDEEIVHFISGYDDFNLKGAYYAMKCLIYAKAVVHYREGILKWSYKGDVQERACTVPSTLLISHLKYDIYGSFGSNIFSSPLCDALKRIELGAMEINRGAINSVVALLNKYSDQDLMVIYALVEILEAINRKGHVTLLTSQLNQQIKAFLRRCTTRKGYVANPTTSSVTLESTYAGHRVGQYLGIQDPSGVLAFLDTLQNENGGFRRSESSGISTLENCYLAVSTYGLKAP